MKNLSGLHRRTLSAHTSTGVVRRAYWVKDQSPHVPANAPVKASDRLSVSYGLLFASKANQGVAEALRTIDRTHRVPRDLYHLKVNVVGDTGCMGVYRAWEPYSDRSSILINKHGKYPINTLVHEYGHFLDHRLFGSGKPTYSAWASFQATKDPNHELAPLMRAIYKSYSVRKLTEQHTRNKTEHNEPRLKTTTYMLMPQELFARSYEQWVMRRQGSVQGVKGFLADANSWREHGYRAYWDRWEFDPIAREFDRLFQKRGLLRKGHK